MSPLRRSRVQAVLVLATILVLVAGAPASAGAPTDRLRDFFAGVNAIFADRTIEEQPLEKVARIRRLITDVADMSGAAASALGPEWKVRTSTERTEFVALFAELLERAYVGRLAGAVRVAGAVTLTYLDEAVSGDAATVTAALRGLGGHDVRVEYRMTLQGGRWRVNDIVLDGVSTVENYRAQFRRLLQRESYGTLEAEMRAKLAGGSLMFVALERKAPASPVMDSGIAAPPPRNTEDAGLVAPSRPMVRAQPQQTERVTARPVTTAPVLASKPSVPTTVASLNVEAAPPAASDAAPATSRIALGALLFSFIVAGGVAYLRRRTS